MSVSIYNAASDWPCTFFQPCIGFIFCIVNTLQIFVISFMYIAIAIAMGNTYT